MPYEMQLPEGFVFEGSMQFVEAKVVVDRAELSHVFKVACIYFFGCWDDEGPEQTDYPHVPVKVNGSLCEAMIVNMNQFGQLILLIGRGDVGRALGISSECTDFYVRTRDPQHITAPTVVEQGVMVHCSDTDPDGPVESNHADAIMAYRYLRRTS